MEVNINILKTAEKLCILNPMHYSYHYTGVIMSVVDTQQWRIQDFPEEGVPTPQGGTPTYDFAKISQKLHEFERIWTLGGRPLRPP